MSLESVSEDLADPAQEETIGIPLLVRGDWSF